MVLRVLWHESGCWRTYFKSNVSWMWDTDDQNVWLQALLIGSLNVFWFLKIQFKNLWQPNWYRRYSKYILTIIFTYITDKNTWRNPFLQNSERLPLVVRSKPACHYCSAGLRSLFDVLDVWWHQTVLAFKIFNIWCSIFEHLFNQNYI